MQMRFIGPMVLSPDIFYVFIYIVIPVLLFYKAKALPKHSYSSLFCLRIIRSF
jgi:hypothetical protein